MKIKLFLFYLLSFTWGILTSLVGLFILLILMYLGYEPRHFHGRIYIEVGKGWGGSDFGCFFICEQGASETLKRHECGHGIQNIIFGPITPFIISIPSVVRYWYRELKYYKKNKSPKTSYDSIWFEKQATMFGDKYFK